jgi:predicted ATPase
MQQAVELAREGDPFSLALALVFAAGLHRSLGERERSRELAEELIAIARERGFLSFSVGASVALGAALGGLRGLEELRSGIARAVAARMTAYLPQWQCLLAEVSGELGRTDDALAALDAAFASSNALSASAHVPIWDAELHRVKGEIRLAQDSAAEEEAESLFLRALGIARRQQARSFELRAATNLGRLLRNQGKRDEARALLAPVYDWFTEGFDTADLKDAKALLDDLS